MRCCEKGILRRRNNKRKGKGVHLGKRVSFCLVRVKDGGGVETKVSLERDEGSRSRRALNTITAESARYAMRSHCWFLRKELS